MRQRLVKGLSHITLIVKDLDKTLRLFTEVFGAREVYSSGDKTFLLSREKFFLLGNIWFAIMEGEPVQKTYNHIALDVDAEDIPRFEEKLRALGIEMRAARSRKQQEGTSLYFYDYDNHLFELHAGTLEERLSFYEEASQAK